MNDHFERDRQLQDLIANVSGLEPTSIARSYFAQPTANKFFHAGTVVPALGTRRYVIRSSGLAVPEGEERNDLYPIDLIATYVALEDAIDTSGVLIDELAIDNLSRLPFAFVARFLAALNMLLDMPGVDLHQLDTVAVRNLFVGAARNRILQILSDGKRRFVAPQILLCVLKDALRICPDSLDEGVTPGGLGFVLLAKAHQIGPIGSGRITKAEASEYSVDLGVRIADADVPTATRLAMEIVANQHFNSPPNPVSLFARYQRRWREIPSRRIDLVEEYERRVGVPFDDVAAVAASMWAMAVNGRVVTSTTDLRNSLGWSEARLSASLDLLAQTREQMLVQVEEEEREFGHNWSFSTFERFPALRLDTGHLLLISPDLIMRRMFGWLPLFDIKHAIDEQVSRGELASNAAKAAKSVVETELRENTETYTLEVLGAMAPRSGPVKCLWDGQELRAAFGNRKGLKLADAAIEVPNGWLVFEVSSRSLERSVVSATSPRTLLKDIMLGVVEKGRQLESTLNELERDERKLTGNEPSRRDYRIPVLVITEGFPVSPVINELVRVELARNGVLQKPEHQPLHIVSIEDLELLERAQETGVGTPLELLLAHKASTLQNMSLRDYLLLVRHVSGRPRRVGPIFKRAFDPLVAVLEHAEAQRP